MAFAIISTPGMPESSWGRKTTSSPLIRGGGLNDI